MAMTTFPRPSFRGVFTITTLVFLGMIVMRPAADGAADAASAELSDVTALRLSSGSKAAVVYTVTHQISAPLEPGIFLPGVRVDRQAHPAAYDGVWGIDAGDIGAWLSPQGNFFSQFDPVSRLIESTYFTNRLHDATAAFPLAEGDRFELMMGNILGNCALPSDRERGVPGGTVGWDLGLIARQVNATHAGSSNTADVIVFRADVVVRGGDLDARGGTVNVPPLVIDLPRIYPAGTTAMYLINTVLPFTAYLSGFRLEVQPALGKAIVTASAKGYIFEAKEYTRPGGGQATEWHLPLTGVIMMTPEDTPAQSHAFARMPLGGRAIAGDGNTVRELAIPAGGMIETEAGLGARVRDAAGVVVSSELENNAPRAEKNISDVGAGSPVLNNELNTVSTINASLSAPVDLVLGNKNFALTLDPDFRGEGLLALRALRKAGSGESYAKVVSVPYAVIDGTPIALTRNRLVDLRVLPVYKGVTVTFTGQAGDPSLVRTRKLQGGVFPFGLTIDAVYDLGDRRYAFVQFLSKPDLAPPDYILSEIRVRSLDGASVQTSPVQYLELTETGPVDFGGVLQANEFSQAVDFFSTSSLKSLVLGRHEILPTIFRSGIDGRLTVLRAPAPSTPNPAPNPGQSIADQPLAFYYTPPAGTFTQTSSMQTILLPSATSATPHSKALGEVCGAVQVEDDANPDATPAQDIVRAWFDADDVNLYATLQLRDVPTASAPATPYSWGLFWRYEHSGRYARATLDPAGQWTFDTGGFNAGYFPLRNVTGEVQPGANGYVRIAIPRSFLRYRNGEVLRDTSAHSYVGTSNRDIDRAPESAGADATFGTGGDYRVAAPCGLIPLQLLKASSAKMHDVAGVYEIDLTGGSGVECRTGGPAGSHQLVFSFSNRLQSVDSATVAQGTGIVSSSGIDCSDTHRYIVNLTDVADAQALSVDLTGVTDTAGNVSGGVPLTLRFLLGDTGGNGTVNSSDIGQTKASSGQAATSANFRTDVNANGVINSSDIGVVKAKSGNSLP